MTDKRKKSSQAEFTKWFGPLLNALRELGGSGRPKEVTRQVAKNLKISDDILEETTKTGIPKFHNQVAWARQYLVWEGLLDASSKGIWTRKRYILKMGRNKPKGKKGIFTNRNY